MTSTIRVLAAQLCAASVGYADLVVYTSEAAWPSALTGAPGVENLETQSGDFLFGNGVYTFETSSGGSEMSFTSNVDNYNVVEAIMDDSPYRDGLGGTGTTMLSLRGIENGEALSITLPGASSAFGFDYDNYDFGGDTLSLVVDGIDTGADIGLSTGFLGVVETTGATFVNVSIANINDGVVYNAFDNFQYGIATIPEPSAALIFGLVASGVGVTAGRRRRVTENL